MPEVSERSGELDGLPFVWRQADADDGAAPVLYLHGVPTASWDWVPFLERTGGVAPDLPGFGRSAKRGDLDYSIGGLVAFIERFLDEIVEIEQVRLVMHDWGAVGLAFAQRHPSRVERLVLIDAVPFLPDFEWHRIGRICRTPVLGELLIGLIWWPFVLRWLTRKSNVSPLPEPMLTAMYKDFDPGTERAMVRLYRSASPAELTAAGADLRELAMPALVVWGDRDPYLPPSLGEAYARAIPGAELVRLADAGHWPWLDQPELIERVATFLQG
jgi:pimeloyl-ACP methyl ester carboxylesterase